VTEQKNTVRVFADLVHTSKLRLLSYTRCAVLNRCGIIQRKLQNIRSCEEFKHLNIEHFSIHQDPSRFVDASSLMGVRSGLTSTAWGRKYIAWLYFCKVVLLVIAFLLIREPLYRVVLGYLAAYFSLMLVRDAVTLKDKFVLRRLGNPSSAPPEIR
jgi:hypothetical protein